MTCFFFTAKQKFKPEPFTVLIAVIPTTTCTTTADNNNNNNNAGIISDRRRHSSYGLHQSIASLLSQRVDGLPRADSFPAITIGSIAPPPHHGTTTSPVRGRQP